MAEVEFLKIGDWYFAASPPAKISQWTVWCSRIKLAESSPAFEPDYKEIWFEFGRTKEEATEKLKAEVFNVY